MSEIEYARLARKFQKRHRTILRELDIAVAENAVAKRNHRWRDDAKVNRAIEAHRALLRTMLDEGEALLSR